MTLGMWVGIVLICVAGVYIGIGWWITSGDGTHGRDRLKWSLILPALYLVMFIMLIWDSYRHPRDTNVGWD
jgi:hypothetical protein